MTHLRSTALGVFLCTGCACGCTENTNDETDPTDIEDTESETESQIEDESSPYPIEDIEVVWTPCSLYEGANDGLAQCADVEVPLFWDDPKGSTLLVRAKRLVSQEAPFAQLWLLAGGPGQAGTYDMAGAMEAWRERYPGIHLYTLDHRGTGYSHRLSCPTAETSQSHSGTSISRAELPGCIRYVEETYGDVLPGISATGSAVDVGALLEASRVPDIPVFVSGGSYGTYWAQRYLQIFPDQADGIILSGIAPPDVTVINYDELTNGVAQDLMDRCGADSLCNSKLGDDPWGALGAVLEQIEGGHCVNSIISRDLVRTLFAYLLYWNDTNIVVPAATYRLARCEPADQLAIENLYQYLFGTGGTWDLASYSILLQHHIQLSEMWTRPDFDDVDLDLYFQQIYDTAYVLKNGGPMKKDIRDVWPIYEDAQFDNGWAYTDVPMLMLQGRLDPATPHEQATAVGDHFSGEHQHFVVFENAAHGIAGHTPTIDGTDCGYQIITGFMENPTANLDTSCLAQMPATNFVGTEELAQAVFGTVDLWENTAAE